MGQAGQLDPVGRDDKRQMKRGTWEAGHARKVDDAGSAGKERRSRDAREAQVEQHHELENADMGSTYFEAVYVIKFQMCPGIDPEWSVGQS